MHNFAITGVAGYIAPRHLQAIRDTGNHLVAACDPHDSVGILDRYFPNTAFFSEFERFDRHLEKLKRADSEHKVDYVTVASPNHLHDAHCRLALRVGADVICEKPLVMNPWNLDALQAIEAETGQRVWTILQLRTLPSLLELKARIDAEARDAEGSGKRRKVELTYITGRGPWYDYSWKGQHERSGGIATNIGIHFFDMLMWLFGPAEVNEVHRLDTHRASGFMALRDADVSWYLSIDMADLPFEPEPGKRTTFRSIAVDGEEIEFSTGFTDLHTRVYEMTLAGEGFGIEHARPSIELVHAIRNATPNIDQGAPHPFLANAPK